MEDELSEIAIANVLRNHSIFKSRSMKFMNFTKEGMKLANEVKIPDDKIICDWCNAKITTAIINLVIILKKGLPNGNIIVDKAVCSNCRKKYYSKTPDFNTVYCRICKNIISDFKNEISKKEFLISGLCQECQDQVFGDL